MSRSVKHTSVRHSIGVALLVGTLYGVPAVAAPPSAEQLASPQWIEAGRAKFTATCAFCHGTEGDAGKHRPFREHIDWDPAQIHDVIRDGRQRGANVMPSWKDSIDDEKIWQIVAYIKSLAGKPKQPPPAS